MQYVYISNLPSTLTFFLFSGIVEGDVILSLQQTKNEPKAVEEESQEVEDEASELDVSKLFKSDDLKCSVESSDSLYKKLKKEPEALNQLPPPAGDTIITLDFNNPGQNLFLGQIFIL